MRRSGAAGNGSRLNESPSEKEGKSDSYCFRTDVQSLNESPSEKEGKYIIGGQTGLELRCLNESPSEKEGKFITPWCIGEFGGGLNESPSEKEGKSSFLSETSTALRPQ